MQSSTEASRTPWRRYATQIILAILIVVGMAKLAGLLFAEPPKASQGAKKKAAPLAVETLSLVPQDFRVAVQSFGTVQAGTRSTLFPQVSGQVVTMAPQFRAGLAFKRGDVLLTLDSSDYELALQQAKTAVVQAQASLAEEQARSEQAQRDWRSQSRSGPISDFALRKPQLALAQSQLESAQASLRQAELNFARTQVRAPYDGRVLSTALDIGELAGPSQPIGEIYATDTLEVRLPINVQDLAFIELPGTQAGADGARVKFKADAGILQVWHGRLMRTEPEVDARTQQLYVIARIEDSDALRLGQYLSAEVSGRVLQQALVVPNSVIYQAAYVYVVDQDRLHKREIRVRWRNDQYSVIEAGLNPGDQVVTTLLGQVSSGLAVTVMSTSEATTAVQEPDA